jgi:hypothetical protein
VLFVLKTITALEGKRYEQKKNCNTVNSGADDCSLFMRLQP